MSEAECPSSTEIDVIIPEQAFLYETETLEYILCKPKLLPLKSVSLEKLEKMQKEANEKIKANREIDQSTESRDKPCTDNAWRKILW
ncbi:BBSome-interacting protein 1 [Fopius arisanus]|uniref:BBSome-interacting protein 1 n=1 Tax=Fopius arisanus TaxID=64838 RepID=A0A9R1TEB5_9HYME|nr:PREDICTED: BBSome-interacting protein 1 [Fopius arisanus]XP_011307483.1 PREDICTED: BBSome-interacting protein 1 [Fopius arisanus]